MHDKTFCPTWGHTQGGSSNSELYNIKGKYARNSFNVIIKHISIYLCLIGPLIACCEWETDWSHQGRWTDGRMYVRLFQKLLPLQFSRPRLSGTLMEEEKSSVTRFFSANPCFIFRSLNDQRPVVIYKKLYFGLWAVIRLIDCIT